jgi:hypothetical protein
LPSIICPACRPLELQRSNVLEVTLRQTRDRFTAGEVTRTDLAQAARPRPFGDGGIASTPPRAEATCAFLGGLLVTLDVKRHHRYFLTNDRELPGRQD